MKLKELSIGEFNLTVLVMLQPPLTSLMMLISASPGLKEMPHITRDYLGDIFADRRALLATWASAHKAALFNCS